MSRRRKLSFAWRVQTMLLLATLFALSLLAIRMFVSQEIHLGFLAWNLFLAWIPVPLAFWLRFELKKRPWMTWQNLLITFTWLLFLPNSFYVITDALHLTFSEPSYLIFDIALIFSIIVNSMILGYISVFMVHRQLLIRHTALKAHQLISGVFFLSGFGIYLGRYLRWNSWDVLASPFGLIFDLSEIIIHPFANWQAYSTTLVYAGLIGVFYAITYEFIGLVGEWNKK